MLRKTRKKGRRHSRYSTSQTGGTVGQLIANFMFYGVSIESRIGTEQSVQGSLVGVRITDLTPEGKRYPEIVSMGLQTESFVSVEESALPGDQSEQQMQCFSFSVVRSPRATTSATASEGPHDVRFSAFVPSIYYTHSVNFVYEMEMFVSDFQSYSAVLTHSFKSAAVGVAKGLVRDKSQLSKGLGKLSTSFGPASVRSSFNQSANGRSSEQDIVTDEPDMGILEISKDKIYFDVSVQSPVIVLPRTLRGDDCLIAHLGEISVRNEFLSQQSNVSFTNDTPTDVPRLSSSEVDRMVLKIENMSLHASHDQASKDWLLSKHRDKDSCTSSRWFKVLNETSFLLRIDRSIGEDDEGIMNGPDESGSDESFGNGSPVGTDVVITGEIRSPLLISLPKQVFDQIKSTLKHGIRRKVSSKAKPRPSDLGGGREKAVPGATSMTSSSSSSAKAVRFNPEVQSSGKEHGDSLPTIFASFTLPKLSLELKHMIGGKERDVVYVSFDEFSVQCNKTDPYVTSCNLALKSVIIEDLLQEEESEYRYILASSSKPLPFMSPVVSPKLRLPSVTKTQGLGAPFSRSLFPVAKLMSTPRPRPCSESPLRLFSPYGEPKPPRTLDGAGGSVLEEESEKEDSSTTLQGDSSGLSEVGDLVTVKALFVDDSCPEYATEYNSVSCTCNVST